MDEVNGTISLIKNYVLPFLLIFSISYGILDSVELFKKRIRAMISLLLSAFAVIYVQMTLVPVLESLLPILIYTLLILLGVILIVGMIGILKGPGAEKSWLEEHKSVFSILMLIVFVVLAYFSFQGEEDISENLYGAMIFLLFLGLFILILYFVTKGEKEEKIPKDSPIILYKRK